MLYKTYTHLKRNVAIIVRISHVKIKMAVNYSCLSISCLYSYSYSNKKAKVTICS